MEILNVHDLCKTYGKGEAKVDALKNVSFSLEKGEFAAVLGESGSGKSTLLNCIGALDAPSSGHSGRCGDKRRSRTAQPVESRYDPGILLFQTASCGRTAEIFLKKKPITVKSASANRNASSIITIKDTFYITFNHASP